MSVNPEDLSVELQKMLSLLDMKSVNAKKLVDTLDLRSIVGQINQRIDEDTANLRRTPIKLVQALTLAFKLQQQKRLQDFAIVTQTKKRIKTLENVTSNDPMVFEDIAEAFDVEQSLAHRDATNAYQLLESDNITAPAREESIEPLDPVQLDAMEVIESHPNFLVSGFCPEQSDNVLDELVEDHGHPSVRIMPEHAIVQLRTSVVPEHGMTRPARTRIRRGSRANIHRRRIPFCVRWGNSLVFLDPVDEFLIAVLPNLATTVDSVVDDIEAVHQAGPSRTPVMLGDMDDIAGAVPPIRNAPEETSAESPASANIVTLGTFKQGEEIFQRKIQILSRKDEREENYIYSLIDLTPEPMSKINLSITFIALLQLSDEGMVKIITDEKLFFMGVTIN